MRYFMLNKPKGVISACSDERHKTVLDLFPEEEREGLFHVGRLDKDTEGLLIVTDDGALCHKLMMPEHKVVKTYRFVAMGVLTYATAQRLEAGVNIGSTVVPIMTAPAKIEIIRVGEIREYTDKLSALDRKTAERRPSLAVTEGEITVTEGKKHEVKRIIGNAGLRVVYLKRLSIAALSLDPTLETGEYRELSQCEIDNLKAEAN